MQNSPSNLPEHLGLTPCRHGTMLYLKQDYYVGGSLARYGEFSEGEFELFRELLRPGDVVVEAGANIGAHTVGLSRLVGPDGFVHAFEPQRIIFQMLCANIALNGLGNVRATQHGLAAAAGTLRVPPLDYTKLGNYGGISLTSMAGELVPLGTIDDLALDRLRLIKVDVEGMEGEVLAGAADTIARLRPILYVENDREANSPDLIRRIQGMGYRLWWHLPRLYNPQNYFQVPENSFGPVVSINMVCVPTETTTRIGLREITDPDADWRAC